MGNRELLILASACSLVLLLAYAISEMDLTDGQGGDANSSMDGQGEGLDPSGGGQSLNGDIHEDPEDYVWEGNEVTTVELNGDSISVPQGAGATVAGSQVTITSPGTYRVSGSLDDGQIFVNTQDEGTVRLILGGVNISCSTSAPIYVVKAKKAVIVLEEGTENHVADGVSYSQDSSQDDPNAAIFSKSDLTICGEGSLSVVGNYNDGIASKDGLMINSGTITVTSVDDGIRGKDYLIVEGGDITLDVVGDGLKSDNDADPARGYVSVEAGMVSIESGGDAIQAVTAVTISGGEFTITSGGGSARVTGAYTSAKGIKSGVNITISGGTITVDSADDAVHSNDRIAIYDGNLLLSTGDDGIHADSSVEISGGEVKITKSYEGIEGEVVTIDAGEIHIVSSDDGVNVVGPEGGGGMNPGGAPGGRTGPGGMGGMGQEAYSGDCFLYMNGGYVGIDAMGDGIDVNGAVEMAGGYLIVNGPTGNMNGALDFGSFTITGGFVLAVGSSGMAQAPADSSAQRSVLLGFRSSVQAGAMIHVQDSEGKALFSFVPTKYFQSIAFSSPDLVEGNTYDVYVGGSSTGTAKDGLILDGEYTPGTLAGSFTA